MSTTPQSSDISLSDYLISLATGVLLAYCIGVATITAVYVAIPWLRGRQIEFPPEEEWGVMMLNVAMVAFPFGLLALAHVWKPLPWIIGTIMTVAFWGLLVISALTSGPGVNIGMAMFMMVSPIIVAISVFAPVIKSDLNG